MGLLPLECAVNSLAWNRTKVLCTMLNKGNLPNAKENPARIPKTVYNVLVTVTNHAKGKEMRE